MDDNGHVQWIIQKNLLAENDLLQLQCACGDIGVPYQEMTIIPFAEDLPFWEEKEGVENIYYGSTTFMMNIAKQRPGALGLFYNPRTFSMQNYFDKWGDRMLNYGATLTTLEEFVHLSQGYRGIDTDWFLRPQDDSKCFDGLVMTFDEVSAWYNRLYHLEKEGVALSVRSTVPILVGPAYDIGKEWRTLIVNEKVITASLYRKRFRLSKSATDIPRDMIRFAEGCAKIYSPHAIYLLDIGLTGAGYEIVEAGCANSAGFYAIDIYKYVKALTHYVEERKRTS